MKRKLSLSLIAMLLGISGCQKSLSPAALFRESHSAPPSALTPSPPGMVRLTGQKTYEDAKTVRWRWIIIGDRNWNAMASEAYRVELDNSSSFGSKTIIGGVNAYANEITITATRGAGNTTDLTYMNMLQGLGTRLGGAAEGNRASMSTSSGTVKHGLKKTMPKQAVKGLLMGEKTLALPVEEPVLEVTGHEMNGKPYRTVFRIRISR